MAGLHHLTDASCRSPALCWWLGGRAGGGARDHPAAGSVEQEPCSGGLFSEAPLSKHFPQNKSHPRQDRSSPAAPPATSLAGENPAASRRGPFWHFPLPCDTNGVVCTVTSWWWWLSTTVDFSTLIVSWSFVHSIPSRGCSVILSSGPPFPETPRCPGGMATKPCGVTRLNGDPSHVCTFVHRSPEMSFFQGGSCIRRSREGSRRAMLRGRPGHGHPGPLPLSCGGRPALPAGPGQPCLLHSWAGPWP